VASAGKHKTSGKCGKKIKPVARTGKHENNGKGRKTLHQWQARGNIKPVPRAGN